MELSLDLSKEIFSDNFSMESGSADTLEEELNNINEGICNFSWNPNDLKYNNSDDYF